MKDGVRKRTFLYVFVREESIKYGKGIGKNEVDVSGLTTATKNRCGSRRMYVELQKITKKP